MRRDKTFTRILLIFSIANVVLAAPAVVRQRHFVTDRSEDEPTDESTLLPDKLVDSYSASQSSAPSGSVTQASPPSSAESLHQDSAPVSVAPQLNDPQPVSGTSELHVPPFTSGNPPSQDDVLPASEAAQLHSDPLSGSRSQPLYEDMAPSWYDWRPNTEIEEVVEPDVHVVHKGQGIYDNSEIEEVAEPDVHDVHKDPDYYDNPHYFNLDDDEIKRLNFANNVNEVKPKTKPTSFWKSLCGLLRFDCWDGTAGTGFEDLTSDARQATLMHWRRIRSFR